MSALLTVRIILKQTTFQNLRSRMSTSSISTIVSRTMIVFQYSLCGVVAVSKIAFDHKINLMDFKSCLLADVRGLQFKIAKNLSRSRVKAGRARDPVSHDAAAQPAVPLTRRASRTLCCDLSLLYGPVFLEHTYSHF